LIDEDRVLTAPQIAQPDRVETFPSWSPDGEFLYYCCGQRLPMERFAEARFDLKRVRYDAVTHRWGDPERILSARDLGMSILQPRVSPDGRHVLLTLCRYGSFPVFRPESDLYLLDLDTRRLRCLEINSDQAESWHGWSSNGRWLVFSSKRGTGEFTRVYFSYFDHAGRAHKPFVLPQADPSFYDSCIRTFTVPELISAPVVASQAVLADAVRRRSAEAAGLSEPSVPY